MFNLNYEGISLSLAKWLRVTRYDAASECDEREYLGVVQPMTDHFTQLITGYLRGFDIVENLEIIGENAR